MAIAFTTSPRRTTIRKVPGRKNCLSMWTLLSTFWSLYRNIGGKFCAGVQNCCNCSISLILLSFYLRRCRNWVILLLSNWFAFISCFYYPTKKAFRNTFTFHHCLQICILVLKWANSGDVNKNFQISCKVRILGFYGSKRNFLEDCLYKLIQGTICVISWTFIA